jgi:chromosome segregation ATPase
LTPRTIRMYIEQGKLEAKPHGEGARKTWYVAIDSLYALRDVRTTSAQYPHDIREVTEGENIPGNLFREIADRLELKAAEVAELRTRLEITERAESTLREERQRLLEDLQQERRRTQEALEKVEESRRIANQLQQQRMATRQEVETARQEAERFEEARELERQKAQEEADRLREELDAERNKGFFRRLFRR